MVRKRTVNDGVTNYVTLHFVMYVPKIMCNTISESKTRTNRFRVFGENDDGDSSLVIMVPSHNSNEREIIVSSDTFSGLQ